MASVLTLREFGERLRAEVGPDSEWGDAIIDLCDEAEERDEPRASELCDAVAGHLETWRTSRNETADSLAESVQAHIEAIDDVTECTDNTNRVDHIRGLVEYRWAVHELLFDAGLIANDPDADQAVAILRMFLPNASD